MSSLLRDQIRHHPRFVALALVLAAYLGFIAAWIYEPKTDVGRSKPSDLTLDILPAIEDDIPRKFVIIVEDGSGFYCGENRLPDGDEAAYIAAIAKASKLHYVVFEGTAKANYGKLVTLISELDRKIITDFTINTYPVESGLRAPPIGDYY